MLVEMTHVGVEEIKKAEEVGNIKEEEGEDGNKGIIINNNEE